MNNLSEFSLYLRQLDYDNYNSREDMLMYTKDEFKNENMKVNTKLAESSTPKQLPSIWYS